MSTAVRHLLAACAVLLLVTGCGRGITRKPTIRATGQVTVGGQDVKTGKITFALVGSKTAFTGTVRNGRFSLSGTVPMAGGEYDVTVEYMSSGLGSDGFDQKRTQRLTVSDWGQRYVTVKFP